MTLRGSTIIGLASYTSLLLPEWDGLMRISRGPLFMLIAAMGWAAGTVGLKYCRFSMPVVSLVGWRLLLGGIRADRSPFFDRGVDPELEPACLARHRYAVLVAMIYCHWAGSSWCALLGGHGQHQLIGHRGRRRLHAAERNIGRYHRRAGASDPGAVLV
jgi:hypothetical protein